VIKEAGREEELEAFHHILDDISMRRPTEAVRQYLVTAYARGIAHGCAENAELEGSTAVFTKRRFFLSGLSAQTKQKTQTKQNPKMFEHVTKATEMRGTGSSPETLQQSMRTA